MLKEKLTRKGKFVWLLINAISALTQVIVAYGLLFMLVYPLLRKKDVWMHPLISIVLILMVAVSVYMFSLLVERKVVKRLREYFNRVASVKSYLYECN